jgi:hypothetical protein
VARDTSLCRWGLTFYWLWFWCAASAVFPDDDGGLREGSSPGRSNVDVEERAGE